MFVGHYAGAFAAKRLEPGVPLWVLFLAVQAVDIAWILLCAMGVEKFRIVPGFTASNPMDLYYMPYTHSLVATIVWATAVFLVFRYVIPVGRGTAAAAAVALGVASHWLGDLLVHTRDLPLYADRFKMGLGLWDYPVAAYLLEVGLLFATAWAYLAISGRATTARGRVYALVGGMAVLQIAVSFGPAPQSRAAMLASIATLFALLAVAAAWAEKRLSTGGAAT